MNLACRSAHSVTTVISLLVTIAVLGAAFAGPAFGVPPSPPPELDHFRCYEIIAGHPPSLPVVLEDQFDSSLDQLEEVLVGFPLGFCNPVKKTLGGPGQAIDILDPNAHLVMYRIHEKRTQRHLTWKVTADNQFGRQTLFATRPVLLGVPTQKVSVDGVSTGLGAPGGLNHFKCYEARGPAPNVVATLEDQFGTLEVEVGEPELFCNPVVKTVGRIVTPIEDAEAHLTCYNYAPTELVAAVQKGVGIINQFNHVTVEPFTMWTPAGLLCVPSNKLFKLGIPGSLKTP